MDIAGIIQREVEASINDWDWDHAGERAASALAEAGALNA